MPKMRLGLLCMLLLLGLSACRQAEAPELQPLLSEPAPSLVEEVRQDGQVILSITLGQLTLSGSKAAGQINQQIQELEQARLAAVLAAAQPSLDLLEHDGQQQFATPYYVFDTSMQVVGNDGQIISLLVEAYEHYQGAAHPLTCQYAYTFDAVSGQRLELSNYWGEEATERIAAAIYSQIEAAANLDLYFDGLAENLHSALTEQSWYTDGDTLYIIYNPYDIAAYAAGIQTFTLPLYPDDTAAG